MPTAISLGHVQEVSTVEYPLCQVRDSEGMALGVKSSVVYYLSSGHKNLSDFVYGLEKKLGYFTDSDFNRLTLSVSEKSRLIEKHSEFFNIAFTDEDVLYLNILQWICYDWSNYKESDFQKKISTHRFASNIAPHIQFIKHSSNVKALMRMNLTVHFLTYLLKRYGIGKKLLFTDVYDSCRSLFSRYVAEPFYDTYGSFLDYYTSPYAMRTAVYKLVDDHLQQSLSDLRCEIEENDKTWIRERMKKYEDNLYLPTMPPGNVVFSTMKEAFFFMDVGRFEPVLTPFSLM